MNISSPDIEERFDIWKYAYSRSAFIESKEIAQLLLTLQPQLTSAHRLALITALVVSYARPFTSSIIEHSRRLIPMKGIPLPPEHETLHLLYLSMRHQVVGHKDATAPSKTGILNHVRFSVHGGNLDMSTRTIASIPRELLTETPILCEKLIKVIEGRLNAILRKYSPISAEDNSVYYLNIADMSKPWIIK